MKKENTPRWAPNHPKVTEQTKREIRHRFRQGESRRDIARSLGLSPSTVYYLMRPPETDVWNEIRKISTEGVVRAKTPEDHARFVKIRKLLDTIS